MALAAPVPAAAAGPASPPGAPAGDGGIADAVSALVNLGYGRAEAFGAVHGAARDLGPKAEVSALIPAALKQLVKT